MKLISQIRREPARPQSPSFAVSRFFIKQARRLPWGKIMWGLFALITASIAIYAVSLMRHALQTALAQ